MSRHLRRNIRLFLAAGLLLCAGCAEGQIGGSSSGGPTDTGDATSPNGNAPVDDVHSTDSGRTPIDGNDAHVDATPRVDTEDATSGACGPDGCPNGVCQPETRTCVECLEDGDCPSGVCDQSSNSCVGCSDDSDCSGDALCHDRESVCISDCCSTTVEDVFEQVGYVHDRFDIAVPDQGEPSIAFASQDADELRYAVRTSGQWLSQRIPLEGISVDLGTNIELEFDSGQRPHVLLTTYDTLHHFWRTADGWTAESWLPSTIESVGYIDFAIDGSDNLHGIALASQGDRVLYLRQSPSGSRNHTFVTLPDFGDNIPVWVNLATDSQGRPMASFQIGNEDVLVLAERETAGNWSTTTFGSDISQVHSLGIGAGDRPVIAHHRGSNDGLRLHERRNGNWKSELIVDSADHGYTPDLAVDGLGDPHVVYRASGSSNTDDPMFYARWNGNDWEHHEISGIDRAFYPKIAVDDDRRAHVVVYDPARDAVSYAQIE